MFLCPELAPGRIALNRIIERGSMMGYANAFKDDIAETFLQENPALSAAQALDYAERVARCELDENYILMNALIQEALYGKPGRGQSNAA
jgi:hypothetical protein